MERLSFAGRVLALGLCLSLALILTWSYRAFSQEEGSSKSSEAVEEAEAREVDTQKDRVIYLAPAKKFIWIYNVKEQQHDVDFDGLEVLLCGELEERGYKVLRPTSFYRALKEKGIPYDVFKEDPFVASDLLEEAGVQGIVEPVFGYEKRPRYWPVVTIRLSYEGLKSDIRFKLEIRKEPSQVNPLTKILKKAVEEFDRSWKSYKNFEEVMRLNDEWSKKFEEINKINR